MRVPAHLRPDNTQPIISVFLDNTDENLLKAFHCLVCGKIVFEYYSNVRIVMAGDFHDGKTTGVIQCNQRYYDESGVRHKCRTLYNLA